MQLLFYLKHSQITDKSSLLDFVKAKMLILVVTLFVEHGEGCH